MTAAALTSVQTTVLSQIDAVAWTTDGDLRIRAVHGGALGRFDWSTWVGRRLGDAFPGESAVVSAHRLALSGRSADYVHKIDGGRWRVCVDPLRGDDGEVIGTWAIAVDLAKRAGYEFASASLDALVSTLPLVVYTATLDEDPRPRFIAPQVEDLLGIAPHEFSFDALRAGVHPEDRERVWAAYDAADARHEDLTLEYRFVRPDGRTLWIEDASRVVEVGGVSYGQGYLLDISARKATEATLARKALVRHRLAAIGRLALDGAPRDEIVERVFALFQEDLEVDMGAILEPRDRELVVTSAFGVFAVGAAAPAGAPAPLAFESLTTYVGPTPPRPASILWEEGIRRSVAVPVFAGPSDCVAVVTVHSRDVNAFDDADVGLVEQVANLLGGVYAREQVEERIRVSQRLEAVGQLAAGVAHDFNNMLTVIAGRIAFALAHTDERGHDHLTQALDATERSRALTSQLLAYSRKQVLQERPVALGEIVDSVMPMLETLVGENITVARAGADAVVVADPGQIENVLVNLTANARDAMPDGGALLVRTGSVDIDALAALGYDVPPGKYGTVEVCDTGLGMPDEVRDRIFEPFFTTKAAGVGTGLGLAGAYGTVRQSRGFITVESGVGAGSTFTVHLPATEDEVRGVEVAVAADVRPSAILLVEDEDVVRELLEEQLASLGHSVTAVATSAAALQRLTSERYDVVLTDVGLPGIDGASLAEAVSAVYDDVAVILMSGYPGDYVHDRHTEQPLLHKPFTSDELRAALARVLG